MPKAKIIKRRSKDDKTKYYIDKDEYTKEVLNYIETGFASDRLGEIFLTHIDHYASSSCFKGYTYLDEMKSQATIFLLKYCKSFSIDYSITNKKQPNAFSYCTTIIHNAFLQIIQREKRHSKIKDVLIKNQDRVNYEIERFNILNEIVLDD
jgi:hypothetical protein